MLPPELGSGSHSSVASCVASSRFLHLSECFHVGKEDTDELSEKYATAHFFQ